jgi:hypothetical protein
MRVVLRRIHGELRAQGHIDNKTAVLVRAEEKLAAENKILRNKNGGLKDAIFKEKRKRKRGKALIFYNEGETQRQALFISPVKITRAPAHTRAANS